MSEWQDISTAPKGSNSWDCPEIELGFPDGRSERGKWEPDVYSKKPRPYWKWYYLSVTTSRSLQPVIWRPLPTKDEVLAAIARVCSTPDSHENPDHIKHEDESHA